MEDAWAEVDLEISLDFRECGGLVFGWGRKFGRNLIIYYFYHILATLSWYSIL